MTQSAGFGHVAVHIAVSEELRGFLNAPLGLSVVFREDESAGCRPRTRFERAAYSVLVPGAAVELPAAC
ncbi:hypothetical protein OHB00_01780 [Streptomyces sp. NBC_00631]|uniref:hypothetical protein n=1 Tax=Streptomyces sp. NBC_00631 TaxID=2975793 RepID=UPI0030E1630E